MFKKIYSRIYLGFTRLLTYQLVKKITHNKSSKAYKEISKLIEMFEKQLIEADHLNTDLTEGSTPVQSKNSKLLVNAFVTRRIVKSEEDFYIQVARTWTKGYQKKVHKTILIPSILFLATALIIIFFDQYLTGLVEDFFYLGLVFFSLVGFLLAFLGSGLITIGFCLLYFFLFIVANIFYL